MVGGNTMARIYKRKDRRGDSNWYIDYTVNGKRTRKKAGPSKTAAKLALAKAVLRVQQEESKVDYRDLSLDEFFEKCINYCKAKNSEAQAVRIEYIIEKRFRPFLRKRYPHITNLSQFTPEVFEEYQVHRIKSLCPMKKTPIRKKTINLETQSLKTMLKRAVEWGFLKENPCKVKYLKEVDSKKIRALTEEEVQALLSSDQDHWLYPVIFTMVYTGMRAGECAFLTWDDVDFKDQRILIRAKDNWIPKSSGGEVRERDIYVGDELNSYLKELKLRSIRHNDNWVFHDRDGRQLARYLSQTFAKLTKKLGFGDVSQIHSLRHTYITHLIRAGNDLPTVQQQAGHKKISTTMKYIDVFVDQKKKAANSLNYNMQKEYYTTHSLKERPSVQETLT
jgi:integrase